MNPNQDSLLLYAVGDIWIDRENPESAFELTLSDLKRADIKFCQLKGCISEKMLSPQIFLRVGLLTHPRNFEPMKSVGFDVVSFASNHCLDYGYGPFLKTIDLLNQHGMQVIGAGKDITSARKPAIINKRDIKVAFLAYNCIMPPGYEADVNKPGTAPMWAYTFAEQIEPDQPGTAIRIHSFARKKDLNAMQEDIARVKSTVDAVVVNFHWGIHFTTATLAEYQVEVAHAAIDAGADLILGTHQHILKGIEVYKGKAIFYGLSNFAFDFPVNLDNIGPGLKELIDTYEWDIDPEWAATYAFPERSRKSLVATCLISKQGVGQVSFLPVMVNKQAQPKILQTTDKEFGEVVDYVKDVSTAVGFQTKFSIEGDEVVIKLEKEV